MPLSAIQNVEVDHIVPTREIAPLLLHASQTGLQSKKSTLSRREAAQIADPTHRDIDQAGTRPDQIPIAPSKFVCPECGGALWEVEEAGLARYRCFTGHGFTLDTLLAAQKRRAGTRAMERRPRAPGAGGVAPPIGAAHGRPPPEVIV
jgi:two-component system chemotaxis response regulator CheB